MALSITRHPEGDTETFRFVGNIDETANFKEIIHCDATTLVFDLGGVVSVNSLGVMSWLDALAALRDSNRLIEYVNCPVVIVEQMCVVAGLHKGVTVRSFYIPMACPSCDIEINRLVTLEEAREPDFLDSLGSRYTCDQCNRHLEFNDDEDEYFRFLD